MGSQSCVARESQPTELEFLAFDDSALGVHLRFGNLRRRNYHEFFAKVRPQVEKLLPQSKLMNVFGPD